MAELLVEVAVNSAPVCIDKTLTYTVPPELQAGIREGSLVLVTVGRQLAPALVVGLPAEAGRSNLKAILAVLDKDYLPPAMVALGRYLAERYLCPLSRAMSVLLPPATGQRLERCWRWLPGDGDETAGALSLAACLPPPAGAVAASLARQGEIREVQLQHLARRGELAAALTVLKSHGLIEEAWTWRQAPRERQSAWVAARAEAAAAVASLGKKAPRQAAVLKELLAGGPQPAAALARGGGYAILHRLEEKGLLAFIAPGAAPLVTQREAIELNPAQEEAAGRIIAALGQGGVFLLHGVTGSGKTEVYLRCAGAALARGYQVLFLVPEHSLIPQMLARLQQRFGDRVAVIQGDLAAGTRASVWEQARQGEISVIVGSRAALFAPLPRPGLIVIDEEHAGSYKQDSSPRYDAREVAIKRGQAEGAVVVMGSATPSTESFYLARTGKIQLLQLPRRAGNADLPRVEIVDMRAEYRAGNQSILSRRLQEGVSAVLAAGRQAILFLNRRGYAPHIICRSCGHVPLCRHCDVSLTYHRDGSLRCHYCGYVTRTGTCCPECGNNMVRLGTGTQRVQEEVEVLWPGVRVLRADRDTTARKGQWEKIYRTFVSGQADILIGTQTITKGMDFPGVTLVGVVNADLSLYQPDFRARERTFQLLTQVAGRAGRRPGGGEVIIQTYNPGDPAIILGAGQDYARFFAQEIARRRELNYPPFVKLVRLGFTGAVEALVIETAHEVAGRIRDGKGSIEVLGPAPGYPARFKDRYRWQLVLKVNGWSKHKDHLARLLAPYRNRRDVQMIVDVGPVNPW